MKLQKFFQLVDKWGIRLVVLIGIGAAIALLVGGVPLFVGERLGYLPFTEEAVLKGEKYVLAADLMEGKTYFLTSENMDQPVNIFMYSCEYSFVYNRVSSYWESGNAILDRCPTYITTLAADTLIQREDSIRVNILTSDIGNHSVRASFDSDERFELHSIRKPIGPIEVFLLGTWFWYMFFVAVVVLIVGFIYIVFDEYQSLRAKPEK